MKIKEIAFVCCAVSNMSRARAFYEGILGLKPNAPVGSDAYCIEYDVGAGTFAIESNPDWPFLPTACQSHSKSTTLKALSTTSANTISPSSSDRLKRRFAIGRRFAPDGNRLVIHKRK
jgi:catechol 2,3-dioxygenase-like lactoylglutathione lyase family enzyme